MQIRCPHCQNPIKVVQDDESFDYDCPSCGSSFNLASDIATLSQAADAAKMFGHFRLPGSACLRFTPQCLMWYR